MSWQFLPLEEQPNGNNTQGSFCYYGMSFPGVNSDIIPESALYQQPLYLTESPVLNILEASGGSNSRYFLPLPDFLPHDNQAYPYDNGHSVTIANSADGQAILPIDNTEPPISQISYPSFPLPPLNWSNTSPSAPDLVEHPFLPYHDAGGTGSSSSAVEAPKKRSNLLKAFIDDNSFLNTANELFKTVVGSNPLVAATTARRTTDAIFRCELCPQTFTRLHNLEFHVDAHYGRKPYSSLCGKTFSTPNSSRRHETTCRACKEIEK